MLDAVLLDWEGILADTRDVRRAALAAACEAHGVDSEALDDLDRRDPTLAELVQLRASSLFRDAMARGLVLTAGAREFLEAMQPAARIGIITQASREESLQALAVAGLDAMVATIASASDARLTSASALIASALSQLGKMKPVHPGHVVVIAHDLATLRAARELGVRSLAVGAPAHVALEADGAAGSLTGLGAADVARIAGVPARQRAS